MQLTPEQEQKIMEAWNAKISAGQEPPSLKEMVAAVFGEEFDGRSHQGKAVKDAMLKMKLAPRPAQEYVSKTAKIILTDDQKVYLENNRQTNSILEMTRTLFNDNTLTNLSAPTLAVKAYVDTLPKLPSYTEATDEDIPNGIYEPPHTLDKALKCVNKYINNQINKEKLTALQKKGLEMLINYMHTFRFRRQMDTFNSAKDRETCEDAFVRYTYDKPDLTQEEVDQYIELANQVVQGFKILRRHEFLQGRLEEVTGNDAETMKISMGLVEAIGKASNEYDQCKKREKNLLDDLKEKRSTRLSKQVRENASILNLVQEWRQEENRQKFLKFAEKEQSAIAREVEKLETFSEMKARILGLSKEQILYG